jgi:signal transduction histidine kinase
VESVKGRGSTFSFSLPLREPQQVFGGTQTHP